MTIAHAAADCQAQDPTTCRYHGNPLATVPLDSADDFNLALDEMLEDNPTPATYQPSKSFPSENLPQAVAIIDRANRRLERAGIVERFTYSTVTSVREVDGGFAEYTTLTLSAPAIKLQGWTFVAAHEFTPNGHVTSHYVTAEALTDTRELTQHCDHCGATRHRQRVYWVQDEAGATKQVGSSCLKAFFGIKPTGLWAVGEDLNFDTLGNGASASTVYPTSDLLTRALVAATLQGGFISRGAAGNSRQATADSVMRDWGSLSPSTEQTTGYQAKAKQILAWAKTLSTDESEPYLRNLREAITDSWVKTKHVPLVVSAIGAFERAEQQRLRQEERAQRTAGLQHAYLAAPGEKIIAVPVTVRSANHYRNDFGGVTMFVFETPDGYTLKWNSSSNPDYKVGDTALITSATVSDNSIYQDVFQTVIKRAKLETVEASQQ